MNAVSRILQVLPCYHERDAIGTHTRHIGELIQTRGYQTGIFVELFDGNPETHPLGDLAGRVDANTILIHHYSSGSGIPKLLLDLSGYKITCYHNITPAHFFATPEEEIIRSACQTGRLQMGMVRLSTDEVWADSAFNALELQNRGFAPGKVLPILRDYTALTKLPREQTFEAEFAGKKNILFVGRVVPNKAFHDLIMTFKIYRDTIDQNVRLILAGKDSGPYGPRLRKLCDSLGLRWGSEIARNDVVFLGAVSDERLASCYQASDVFLCLSDHEGFCVPLIEAMSFGLPVVAHRSSVVPETCDNAALLVDKREIVDLIGALNQVLNDPGPWRDRVKRRALDFAWPQLEQRFFGLLDQAIRAATDRGLR